LLSLSLPVTSIASAQFARDEDQVAQVFRLLDERLSLMPEVAAWKWQRKAPVSDATREEAVVARAVDLAKPLGLRAENVRQLFELQIRIAREVQTKFHNDWRTRPSGFPGTSADLQTQLRPRLDALTAELLRALYLASPTLVSGNFAQRYKPAAEQYLRTAVWTAGAREEVLTALSAMRRTPVPALERIAAAGVLRIGTTGDYAPFSLEREGELAGADIDLARSLAGKLHVEPVFVRTTWATLLEDMAADKFDVALGGISVTPARQAVAAFSHPYASGGKTAIARCTDAPQYRTLAAVNRPQVRLVVNPGGTNEQYVRTHVKQASVRVHQDNRTIFDEIRSGRADVMITDDVEVELQTRKHKDLCRAIPGTLTHADKAILMPQDARLVGEINRWLTGEIKAGAPARLLQQHLGE
jgi:cyclohexadienyl dehydratase